MTETQGLAATPIIPESARWYSLTRNVKHAMADATVGGEVQPLLLMHHFLQGMPEAGSDARELSSTLGKGSTEVPLFGKIFHVPLQASEEPLEFDGPQSPLALLTALHTAGALAQPYKTDIVVFDDPDRGTLKVTNWHADDPREKPHNHPWSDEEGISFISYIVSGGYTETVTFLDGTTSSREYRAGDLNTAPYSGFHTVGDILPGTVTILMTAPRAIVKTKGMEWGYLIFEDGKPLCVGMNDPRVADKTFLVRAAVQNPSMRFALK